LGVDPGTQKVGIAVVRAREEGPLELDIVGLGALADRVAEAIERHAVRAIALGGGTHTGAIARLLASSGLPLNVVDERETTLLARKRYFEANPPRGWRRLLPRGMLLPPCPIDDFAALLIAERFLDDERDARSQATPEPAT
jgi:RNase H-fold protein (predicted Holliday junction resolvase)